jgi:tRNA threonylcarbamoyladenosine biosynthesis protein TsaE
MPKVGLRGGLGAGKTVFIKGFVEGLIPGAEVTSPTYTIMNDYSGNKKTIYHVDLYRINSMEELLGTGFFEAFEDPKTIMLMEWSERFPKPVDFTVDIRHLSDNERGITIEKGAK